MKPLVSPPMTMADFFEASRGTWLNRRVVHHLDSQDDEFADSNLIIEPFDSTDPVVENVCQALNIRMRVSSIQFLDGVAMTTYCTEFRCPSQSDIVELSAAARARADASPSETARN